MDSKIVRKLYRDRNKERIKIQTKESYERHGHKYNAKKKQDRLDAIANGLCSICKRIPRSDNRLCRECRAGARFRDNELTKRVKREAVAVYGGKCVCCGEAEINFLTIDHPNNDGAKHRKNIGAGGGGRHIYRWLKARGYPREYRLLCFNCNCARGFYGYCPHEIEKQEIKVGINLLAKTAFGLLKKSEISAIT